MPGLTPYFVNKIVDHCLRGQAWTPPTTVYLKLHLADPGFDGSAAPSLVTTRKPITWAAVANGATSSTVDLVYNMTTLETIPFVSAWDSATAGNCLFTSKLDTAKNFYSGDTFTIPSLTFQIKPGA